MSKSTHFDAQNAQRIVDAAKCRLGVHRTAQIDVPKAISLAAPTVAIETVARSTDRTEVDTAGLVVVSTFTFVLYDVGETFDRGRQFQIGPSRCWPKRGRHNRRERLLAAQARGCPFRSWPTSVKTRVETRLGSWH
jgi:hypothetical protein